MAEVKHFKEDTSTMPSTTVPNAIYFVKNGLVYDEYLTTKLNQLLPVGNTALINALIAAAAPPVTSGDSITGIAGEVLGGGKLVYLAGGKFFLYDANNTTLADMAFGITKGAAILNATVDVQFSGIFTEVGLGLTPEIEYFAGLNGLLSSNPTYATFTSIGIALNTNSIKIEIQPSIITA